MDIPESSHMTAMNNLQKMAANRDTQKVLSIPKNQELLDRGGVRNNTALHLAILYGHKDTARVLVEHGANLTILNEDRHMPITYCSSSDPEMLETLLLAATTRESGIDSQVTLKNKDSLGRSILHYASLYLKEARSMTLIRKLLSMARSEHLLLRDEEDQATFLEAAAKIGNSTVVEALKWSIHDIDTETRKALINGEVGMTALMHGHRDFFNQLVALSKIISTEMKITLADLREKLKEAAVQKLGDNARKEELARLADENGLPTYLALYAEKDEVFKFLLQSGLLTVNQWDKEFKRTCLHWAVLHKRADIVEKLVKSWDLRPNPGIKDAKGKTALQIAFEENNQEAIELLRGRPPFKEYEEKLLRDRDVYVQALNAVLVGAALIGSVTFAGWLQLPSQTEFQGLEMKVFWVSNGVSFYSAVAAMCVAIAALLPTPTKYVGGIANQLRLELLVAALFLKLSLAGVAMAFAGAGFAATGAASLPESDCADDDTYGGRHTSPSWGPGLKECESLYRKLMLGSTIPGAFFVATTLAVIMYRLLVDVVPMDNMRRRLFAGDITEDPLQSTNSDDLVELVMRYSKDLHESLLIERREAVKNMGFHVN